MPSAIYDRSPIRFKLPERNGGVITGDDIFPGINYYASSSDVVLKNGYASVFSTNFNVYSSVIAPKLVQYIPSLDIFSFTFYKGIYIYNPSIEKDAVRSEVERKDIFFSITGGSTFTLGDLTIDTVDPSDETLPGSPLNPVSDNVLFYEGSYYRDDLTDAFSLNGQNRTSANNNIKVSISPEIGINRPLSYFELDGTSQVQDLSVKNYIPGNEGIIIPSLKPGDYLGLYLKFETMFSIDSKPVDYAFFNLRYENITTEFDEYAKFDVFISNILWANQNSGLPTQVTINLTVPLEANPFEPTFVEKLLLESIEKKLFDLYGSKILNFDYDPPTIGSIENIKVPSSTHMFPSREIVPGRSLKNFVNQDYFIQSFALKFNTNFADFVSLLNNKVDVFYDNYPPFFSDYRESDDL